MKRSILMGVLVLFTAVLTPKGIFETEGNLYFGFVERSRSEG
jgi:hypothetical protein